jgi:hypothetical protein
MTALGDIHIGRRTESPPSLPGAAHERRHPRPTDPKGLPVRSDDIDPLRGIRYVAWLFKGIAVLLLGVTVLELGVALSGPGTITAASLIGEAVRMLAFAGLLWGAADLALMLVHSHYDLRATRILLMRQATLLERLAPNEREIREGRAQSGERVTGRIVDHE